MMSLVTSSAKLSLQMKPNKMGMLAADVYDEDSEPADEPNDQALMEINEDGPSNAVILHEDKQYYPTAQQVYGPDVETMVQEEDAQPLTQPIIAPVTQKKFQVQETDLPPVFYSREFMTDLLSFPEQILKHCLRRAPSPWKNGTHGYARPADTRSPRAPR